MNRPFCGIYMRPSDMLFDQGVDATVRFYNDAADKGFADILAWDNYAQRPQPTDAYPEAAELQAAVKARGGVIIVQVAYFGQMLADAIGDGSVLESGSDQQWDRFACLADPRVMAKWEEQAKRVGDWWPDAAGVMLSYDEYRIQGTHPACQAYSGRYGELLAAHAREAIAMHRRILPGKIVSVWSDMFDPYENAGDGDYYRVKGGWRNSWQAMKRDAEVLVWNWNTKGDESCEPGFRWFAGPGVTHPQIFCGYYDGPGGDGISASDERRVLTNAIMWSQRGLCGYLYTTWEANFDHLEEYAPPPELLARMSPFPAGGVSPAPAPSPQPPPTPSPVPTPDPLGDVRKALGELDEPLSSLAHRLSGVKNGTLRASLKANQQALAAGVAKAKKAAG